MPSLSRFSTQLLAAALAAVLTASSAVALAQDPSALSAAQALVDEGNRAAAAGDYQTALDRFSAAYARYKSPPILLNIATAMRRLGRNAEAGDLYERYLREPGANPQRMDEVRRELGDIDASVGRITISSADPRGRVWLDGRLLPGFPNGGTIRVEPGEHTVAGGREAAVVSEVVRIEARNTRTVWLRAPGMVPVVPAAPAYDEPPPPRRLRVRRPMSGQRIAGIVLDAVGGLGIATGFGLGIAGLGVQQSANDHCLGGGDACEPRALQLEAQARHIGQAATVCLGAGAGVLIAGLIVGGTAPRYDTGSSERGPRVAFGPGSIVVEGSW
jgi:hypothetical protein